MGGNTKNSYGIVAWTHSEPPEKFATHAASTSVLKWKHERKRYVILLLQDHDRRGAIRSHVNASENRRKFVDWNHGANRRPALGEILNNSGRVMRPGRMLLRGMVRTGEAGGVPAARSALFKIHEFGMEIVGQRDHEKQQDQGGGKCGPLAPRSMLANAPPLRPTHAPHA
jgi:hypothetical protein